jgi:hypothetical protein
MYDKLLGRIDALGQFMPAAIPAASALLMDSTKQEPPLRHEDYPNVMYWTQDEWRNSCTKNKEKKGLAAMQKPRTSAGRESARQVYITSSEEIGISGTQAASRYVYYCPTIMGFYSSSRQGTVFMGTS